MVGTIVPNYGRTVVPIYGWAIVPTYGWTIVPTYGRTIVPRYGRTRVPTIGRSGALSVRDIELESNYHLFEQFSIKFKMSKTVEKKK